MQYSVENRDILFFSFPLCVQGQVLFVPLKGINPSNVVINPPNLANLLMKYLSVQREKSRKYSQRWQQQHAADELKTVAAAVNYLSEHGISTLDELDAALSSVSEQADTIRAGMKTAEQRMKVLQISSCR